MLLYLCKLIYSQVLPRCTQQSDCDIQSYCSINNICVDCSYIAPQTCDALYSECCSNDFLHQCSSNPYQCKITEPIVTDTSMNPQLKLATISLCMVTVSYISVGAYRNKYLYQKKGMDIFPHRHLWESLYGLVKDGCSFAYLVINHRYNYQTL